MITTYRYNHKERLRVFFNPVMAGHNEGVAVSVSSASGASEVPS